VKEDGDGWLGYKGGAIDGVVEDLSAPVNSGKAAEGLYRFSAAKAHSNPVSSFLPGAAVRGEKLSECAGEL